MLSSVSFTRRYVGSSRAYSSALSPSNAARGRLSHTADLIFSPKTRSAWSRRSSEYAIVIYSGPKWCVPSVAAVQCECSYVQGITKGRLCRSQRDRSITHVQVHCRPLRSGNLLAIFPMLPQAGHCATVSENVVDDRDITLAQHLWPDVSKHGFSTQCFCPAHYVSFGGVRPPFVSSLSSNLA